MREREQIYPCGEMPTFCRHNRFIERCPICGKTLPSQSAPSAGARAKAPRQQRAGASAPARSRRATHAEGVRVSREGRAQDDGYRSELVPGLRASVDAVRLAEEIAFASERLLELAAAPPGVYGEIAALAPSDLERATWWSFLTVYLCPLEHVEDPFAAIRRALTPSPAELPSLEGVALGPRSSHDPARGEQTLLAYRQWVERAGGPGAVSGASRATPAAGGSQAAAFTGDASWEPRRRFERVFERLALPGLTRAGRYELLVVLGRLGCYELAADALHFGGPRGLASGDLATDAAKRVFGIGDALLLERRAAALADACGAPLEALDLALFNWASPTRATLGLTPQSGDEQALERARMALGA